MRQALRCSGKDKVFGGDRRDTISGESDSDTLFGQRGGDVIVPGAGLDVVDGGKGDDSASYRYSPSAVHVQLSNDPASDDPLRGNARGEGTDSLYSIEDATRFDDELRGGTTGAFLEGRKGDDLVSGSRHVTNSGEEVSLGDSLLGGLGDDTIWGLGALDSITGGGGNDVVRGTGTIWGDSPRLSSTVAGDDRLIASGNGASSVTIVGGGGADVLDGGAGDDRLLGDDGNDALRGFAGNDALNGGDGTNTNDGGDGSLDTCLNPDTDTEGAVNCEQ